MFFIYFFLFCNSLWCQCNFRLLETYTECYCHVCYTCIFLVWLVRNWLWENWQNGDFAKYFWSLENQIKVTKISPNTVTNRNYTSCVVRIFMNQTLHCTMLGMHIRDYHRQSSTIFLTNLICNIFLRGQLPSKSNKYRL